MFCAFGQMKNSFDKMSSNNFGVIPIAVPTEGAPRAIQLADRENKKKNSVGIEQTDTNLVGRIGTLNLNGYATRKTIAQGLLDLALLAANASQLKSVLSDGSESRFYIILLTLIIISIVLQVLQAVIVCILAIVFNINRVEEQERANIINNILVIFTVISVAINVVISTFDMKTNDK